MGPGRVWASVDELDQHVVIVAYERIHALAPAPPRWLAEARALPQNGDRNVESRPTR